MMKVASGVEPGPVDPRAQHLPVVAKQEQEHRRRREQDASESLHGHRYHSQRSPGNEHDGGGKRHEESKTGVEPFRLEEVPVQRVARPEEVTHGIRRPQGHRGGADYGCVQQDQRIERAGRMAQLVTKRGRHPAGVSEIAVVARATKRKSARDDDQDGTS